MNETDEYILDSIKSWVWSGFYTPGQVDEMIGDLLEEDADEESLRAAVQTEFAKKAEAERSWPKETDCDRLDRAFAAMNERGIIALQNAGYTMSDGLEDVGQTLQERGRQGIQGYCFYHEQDTERAVDGGGLTLAFGDLDADPERKRAVGRIVKQALQEFGFEVEWDDDPEKRILIPRFDWKRRSPASTPQPSRSGGWLRRWIVR